MPNIDIQAKSSQLTGLKLLLVGASSIFAALLTWQSYRVHSIQTKYQNDLMASVTQSVLVEFNQFFNKRRLELDLFQAQNNDLLKSTLLMSEQKADADYQRVHELFAIKYNTYRLFTLMNSEGLNILEYITGEFSKDCEIEVKETVSNSSQDGLFLHRTLSGYHFDLIQSLLIDNKKTGFLFVAFDPDFFAELLKRHQLPHQQLFLLRKDKQGVVEISTENRLTSGAPITLSNTVLETFEYSVDIPATRWRFAIKMDPTKKNEVLNQSIYQSILVWLVITFFMILLFLINQRKMQAIKKMRLRVAKSEIKAASILDSVNEVVIAVDCELNISFSNYRATEVFSFNANTAVGKKFDSICPLFTQEKELSLNSLIEDQQLTPDERSIARHNDLSIETRLGHRIPVSLHITRTYDLDSIFNGYIITIEDLSSAEELSKQIVFHENTDRLTGLENRHQLEKVLSQQIGPFRTTDDTKSLYSAMIMFDFDNFQLVNSAHGFKAGDEYLRKVTGRLKEIIPEHFCFSRLGADEFATCVTNLTKIQIDDLANRIRDKVKEFLLPWYNESISTEISVGVVIIDERFSKLDHLLSAADHARRLAKQKGRGLIQYYDDNDPDIQRHAMDIKYFNEISQALALNRFQLYRQKIHSITGENQPNKFEILIRMLNSNNQIVSPAIFIAAAEKYGAMNKIDKWVIEHALKNLSELIDEENSSYAINLSGSTLGDIEFIDFVKQSFEKYKVDPTRIIFEITETSAISHMKTANLFMDAMRKIGCQFSLDDFGTGLASFDYLKKLPIEYIKIDGSFVKEIAYNQVDYSFIEAIQKIASSMKIRTVAEFVENAEILNILEELRVDYAQGYHIHKPELWYKPQPKDN